MRPLLLLLSAGVLLFAAAGGMSAPVPRQARAPVLYHATAPGTVWVYECGNRRTTATLTSAVGEGKRTTLTFTYGEPGDPQPETGQYVVTPDAIIHVGGLGDQFDPPIPVLKVPAKKGDSWPVSAIWRTPGCKECTEVRGVYKVLGFEKVTVPAGTFDTICVWSGSQEGWTFPCGGQRWYAPGVGLVKADTGEDVWVLKSFTPGK